METLFHYCSSSSFASIVSQRSIWLSSLTLSNDSMEGRLVAQVFDRLFIQAEIGAEEIGVIRNTLSSLDGFFDGLGFCLSEKPDLLSQWRGYADDGQGFSIGFSKEYLFELEKAISEKETGFRLNQVVYEDGKQEALLKPTFDEIKSLADEGGLRRPMFGLLSQITEEQKTVFEKQYMETIKELALKVLKTFSSSYLLKNAAFSEEAEWRLVSLLVHATGDSASFRAAGNRLIPYREFQLKPLKNQPISEVYIGPKNITPSHVIENFLIQNGFDNVKVVRSAATYR